MKYKDGTNNDHDGVTTYNLQHFFLLSLIDDKIIISL